MHRTPVQTQLVCVSPPCAPPACVSSACETGANSCGKATSVYAAPDLASALVTPRTGSCTAPSTIEASTPSMFGAGRVVGRAISPSGTCGGADGYTGLGGSVAPSMLALNSQRRAPLRLMAAPPISGSRDLSSWHATSRSCTPDANARGSGCYAYRIAASSSPPRGPVARHDQWPTSHNIAVAHTTASQLIGDIVSQGCAHAREGSDLIVAADAAGVKSRLPDSPNSDVARIDLPSCPQRAIIITLEDPL